MAATLLVLPVSSGCRSESHDLLIGQWVGRPSEGSAASPNTGTNDSDPRRFGFQLDFRNKRQFSMTLIDQGKTDKRSGHYRVTRSRGSRWEIVLNSENPDQSVTLELAFRGENQMAVREVDGDSRLSGYVFERADSTAAAGISTAAVESDSNGAPSKDE